MVEQNTQFRSYDPDFDEFDEHLINTRPATYKFGRSARGDYTLDRSVPLFLSDPDGDPDPQEYVPPPRRSRFASVAVTVLIAVVVVSGAAATLAWLSPDAARKVVVRAKASIASVASSTAAAKPDERQLTATDVELKDPARLAAPAAKAAAANVPPAVAPVPVVVASAAPSRAEISSAYQAALRNATPAAPAVPVRTATAIAPPAAPPAPPPEVKRIGSDELAMLMKRARDSLAIGDIPSARLLLERAAEEGQDANAALLLARTFDPAVLGTSDVRNITPEPEKARAWYQKAAQFGSAEAQQRLAQLGH